MVCTTKDVFGQLRSPRGLLALLIVACGLISTGFAQLGEFKDPLEGLLADKTAAKAEFTATLAPATAKPGDEVTLTVSAALPKNNYIYATTGETDPRTKITIANVVGLEPIDGDFQADRKAEDVFDNVLNVQVQKFHDGVNWTRKYKIASDAEPAKVSVDLELEGQYCSEGKGGTCTLIKPPLKLHAVLADSPADKVRFRYRQRPVQGKTNPAEFKYQLGPVESSKGQRVKLAITMLLDQDWHTFPTTFNGEGGSPTEIDLTTVYGLKPIGEFKPDRPFETKVETELGLTLQVYHNEVTWTQEFEILPDTPPNAYGVEGKIKYQVCKTSCIPKSTKFSIGVTNAEVTPPESVPAFEEAAVVPAPRLEDKGLLVFLLSAVLAGLLSLCTPCVFPMVPITVSFFLKQNEVKGRRSIALALVFSLSIVASFVLIGVGVAAIFGATKPNELANNWILNLFLASIFFIFALNMLGLFEITVPSWMLNMTSSGEQAGGYVGVIFMALTFALTSFSCTFPFVGSLIAVAATGQYYWPILGMTAFGATFATPFFLLAILPGALKSLPKSGGWLNSVKVVMGFVEIGVALKYFSIVDQQWHSVPWLFDYTNVMTLWAVLSFCTGMYLLGQFRLSHDSPVQGLSPIRVLLAVGFLLLGGLFGVGMLQPEREAWLIDQLIAFAPARLEGDAWLDYDEAVKMAKLHNQPLFVDFTGVNCVNCRLMEKRMAKASNKQRLDKFIQAQLYTDKVPREPDPAVAARLLEKNMKLQVEWFGDVTLPSYAIVSPDGKTILARYLGLEPRAGDFARFLDEGHHQWEASEAAKNQ